MGARVSGDSLNKHTMARVAFEGYRLGLATRKIGLDSVFQEIDAMNEVGMESIVGSVPAYFQSSVYSAEDERANLALFEL